MLQSKALILGTIKHTSSSCIVKMYTEEYGAISTFARISGKNKLKGYLTQLNIVDVQLVKPNNSNLYRLKEINSSHLSLMSIHEDIRKTSICFFIAELLQQCLREEESNPSLFTFITERILLLNATDASVSTFHISFLLGLTRPLGFFPDLSGGEKLPYFNLEDGVFCPAMHQGKHYLDGSKKSLFFRAFNSMYERQENIGIKNKQEKDLLLSALITYYDIHIHNMKPLKSKEVLETIFA